MTSLDIHEEERRLIGIDGAKKPFPVIIERNKHLFKNVETVIEIGSGRGRFIRWFKENFPSIRLYVAVEPYGPFVEKYPRWRALRVYNDYWENVKYRLLDKRFDVVIFWDVLMFMRGDPIRTTEEIMTMARRYFLFSLYPAKNSVLGAFNRDVYRRILHYFDTHPELRIVDKRHWNRFYEKVK